jgi:Mg-chelatase subunit ChlD
MELFDALKTLPNTSTDKGMPAHTTSDNVLVDLFSDLGASKGETDKETLQTFVNYLKYNEELGTALALWLRDARGGAGRRAAGRQLLANVVFQIVVNNDKKKLISILEKIVEVGRYDDLVFLYESFNNLLYEFGDKFQKIHVESLNTLNNFILGFYKDALEKEDRHLAGKWFPREGKGYFFTQFAKHYNLTKKELRNKIVSATEYVVEHDLSKKQYDKVEYSKLPSGALNMYSKTFANKDKERYEKYQESVVEGKNKAKTASLYPHDIVSKLEDTQRTGTDEEKAYLDALWQKFVSEVKFDKPIVPVVDLSGSMASADVAHIARALGILMAQSNQNSAYKDKIMAFASEPRFFEVSGDLSNRINQVRTVEKSLGRAGLSTDVVKLFKTVLKCAKENNVKQEDMPSHMVILSDMQFDEGCVEGYDSFLPIVKALYSESGYLVPTLVFWNLTSRRGDKTLHAKHDTEGTILLSGFSQSLIDIIVKYGFDSDKLTPLGVVLQAIDKPRYKLEL